VTEYATSAEDVTSRAVEVQRIMRTGTIWTMAGSIGPALILGPMLASGWRPTELPLLGATAWWVGVLAAAIGLALLVWAGCPVLAFGLAEAYAQKVFSIRVGIVLNLSGMALAGLAILLSPGG
jgi:cation transport ATPase